MTLPFEYQNASMQFDQFMIDARDFAQLATTNMAWNMVVGVLHTFRRRLTVEDALRFADVLPPVIRALFLEKWDVMQPVLTFGDNDDLLAEVRSVRFEHNFSPDNAIVAVALALRKQVDAAKFEHLLTELPIGSIAFWSITPKSG
ncbi:MAG: DUF2267 domain-containing protein [Deltaproteobacteria bacterium]|nr:DUF2267 domain-containing protein [Deltaproteobacteria bacterium]